MQNAGTVIPFNRESLDVSEFQEKRDATAEEIVAAFEANAAAGDCRAIAA